VIEGACRHFVKDRFELSGMRWEQCGAENLLRLRTVAENGDWDDYQLFRRQQRHQRLYSSPFPDQNPLEIQALELPPGNLDVAERPPSQPLVDREIHSAKDTAHVVSSDYSALPLAA